MTLILRFFYLFKVLLLRFLCLSRTFINILFGCDFDLWLLLNFRWRFVLRTLFFCHCEIVYEDFLTLWVPWPDIPTKTISPILGALARPAIDEARQILRVNLQ
jgi:hypothetical protein